MSDHPRREQLQAFVRRELPEHEAELVLAHLGTDCAKCHEVIAPIMVALLDQLADVAGPDLPVEKEQEREFDAIYDRVKASVLRHARRLNRDRQLASEALEATSEATKDRELIEATAQIRGSWTYCEVLLECSQRLRHSNPTRMVWFAEIAQRAADNLDPKRWGRLAVADLRALAWAELGNAYRVADRLTDADRALATARSKQALGSGDPLLEARICSLTAWLRTAQRSFPESLQLLDRAIGIYRSLGEGHLLGKTLVQKSMVLTYAQQDAEIVHLLREGLSLIDANREPKLALAACHNLVCLMVDRGEFDRARRELFANNHLYQEDGDALNLLKKRWLEAQIAAGLGELERAERAFRQVKEGFSEARLGYKEAIVSLEMGLVLLRQGRFEEVFALVREMVAVFKALKIEREGLGALLLLRDVCEQGRLTLGLLANAINVLKDLESDTAGRLEVRA